MINVSFFSFFLFFFEVCPRINSLADHQQLVSMTKYNSSYSMTRINFVSLKNLQKAL